MGDSVKKIKRSGYFKRKLRANLTKIKLFKLPTTSFDDTKYKKSGCNNEINSTIKELPLEAPCMQISDSNIDKEITLKNASNISEFENTAIVSTECTELSQIEMDMRTRQEMKLWALKSNIKHTALRELFEIWNRRIPNMFPRDPRTFLDTPKKIEITKIGGGTYWHNGLAQNLCRALNSVHYDLRRNLNCLSLNFNMDGLPVYKSSKIEFWPILCNIHELPIIRPLVVGIYCGAGKPVDLTLYLGAFVQEMQQILKNGLFVQTYNKQLQIKIRCFICDSPARAFIKGIVNFNGKNGCNKCTVVGEYSYISHCVYFPRIGCEKRNDTEFRALAYGNHHKCYTPLLQLPINMIEDFPVGDSLHLIDLGVMKRCLIGWKDGNMGSYRTKWSYSNITTVSTFLMKCKMPTEIHRAVRGLDVLAFWKGTEFRTFL